MESNSTADANYCQLAIWNADGTAKTTQDKTDGNILHPAMPLDPAEAHQYAVYCSLKTLTEEEKAQYPGLVLNVFDLYDENGTARATYDKPSAASALWLSIYPALSKLDVYKRQVFNKFSNGAFGASRLQQFDFCFTYL